MPSSRKPGNYPMKFSKFFLNCSCRFPAGVVNTVPSLGNIGGAYLAAHNDVDKVAFTGSTLTGRKVMEAAAKSNLKKVSLELGGKSPHLIFESADLDQGEYQDRRRSLPFPHLVTSCKLGHLWYYVEHRPRLYRWLSVICSGYGLR